MVKTMIKVAFRTVYVCRKYLTCNKLYHFGKPTLCMQLMLNDPQCEYFYFNLIRLFISVEKNLTLCLKLIVIFVNVATYCTYSMIDTLLLHIIFV